MLKSILVSLDRDGWRFVLIFAFVTLIFYILSSVLGFLGVILTVWCFYFFRDPDRVTPTREGLIISPADGRVVSVGAGNPPAELELDSQETWTKISIFLNVFDVHVNRVPIDGKLIKSVYHPGKFLNASFDKASDVNERHSYVIKHNPKISIPFVQVAGLIARRIRCDVKEGDKLKAGQRFGMIRFGSRMDVYLPKGISPLICEGQRMIGGETILADLNAKKGSPMEGDIR